MKKKLMNDVIGVWKEAVHCTLLTFTREFPRSRLRNVTSTTVKKTFEDVGEGIFPSRDIIVA